MKSPSKPEPTEEEKALEKVSVDTWNDYITRYRPAEAALAKKAEFTAGERAQVTGEVSADTAAAFKGLHRSTVSSSAVAGADVSSGKTKFSLAADATAQGKARGLGQGAAITGGELDSTQQNLKLTAFGRGLASDVVSNMSRGAQRATTLALSESEARWQRNMANVDAAMTVAGGAFQVGKMRKESKPSRERIKQMGNEVRGLDLPEIGFDIPEDNPFGDYPFGNFGV